MRIRKPVTVVEEILEDGGRAVSLRPARVRRGSTIRHR
jgi:hypothetical protein